ncbi:DUF4972 domain-containing protein [Dysgonomonas sp. BGC7]|uniref:DUF4972 domain-containing protein n=1 Tax=Dysgonomonas sp. BGC7 TaxID=1658008 RepID=UPI0006809208|nr:DUF4972 domain-containing protein [Dysgonomonas sp. BGC7]MBD8388697.1 DUF4972 domain-containing protein [Dysgonomonas sp. BGC7]
MKKTGMFITIICCILSISYSCSDDDKTNNTIYISQLEAKRGEVQYILDNSEYGTVLGTYPEKSKSILETAIADLNMFIDKLVKNENTNQEEVNVALIKADTALKEFKNSIMVNVSEEERSLQRLKNTVIELETLLTTSVYGDEAGTYPQESKSILTNVIGELKTLIDNVVLGQVQLIDEMATEAIRRANDAIDSFQDTKHKEEVIYNLYVDGNKGGYIDFGYKEEFANFGTNQHAAFTIELWVRIDEYCNNPYEDNSTYLSACNDSPWGGWRVYSRYHNGDNNDLIRASITYSDNGNIKLWEPNYGAPRLGYQKWMHFAIVYAEDGLPNEDQDERFRMYYNGERKGESIRLGQDVRHWAYNYANYKNAKIPMTAFCRLKENGDRMEYFSGSIKYMRIWKSAKTSDEIKKSSQGDNAVNPNDPNLVCAWDFVASSKDLKQEEVKIKDITGRHTATLKGAFSWKPIDY